MSKINVFGRDYEREDLTSFILGSWASVTTEAQYKPLEKMLESMTDRELSEFLQKNAVKEVSAKVFFTHQKDLMAKVPNKQLALEQREIEFLREEKNKEILSRVWSSHPSDSITLTAKQDEMLIDLWECTVEKAPVGVFIPSDLFFAQTIPLLDCNITVDERDIGGVECKSRVVVFQDYAEKINESDENDPINVGAVVIPVKTESVFYGQIVCPFYVIRGVDSLLTGRFGWIGISEEVKEHIQKNLNNGTMRKMFSSMMETWYGIQIALLHPKVREVFAHPKTEKEEGENRPSKKKRKRAVRYIKKHIVGTEELETKIYGESKKKKRHALVWYVIGHWRTYKNGTKVFVRPYWKGELRELKMNLEDREREIAI